jgi:hypothetical protein
MRKLMVIGATILSAFAVTFAGPYAALASGSLSTDPPDGVTVEVVTVNGSGCPSGTATSSVSDDAKEFFVSYDSFVVRVGVGAAGTDFRRNCQLNLRIHVPEGYSYAITGVDHRGFAALAAGASAVVRTVYYFSGQSASTSITHSLGGPFHGYWIDNARVWSWDFSPCGAERNLNINTSLRMSVGTSNPATTSSLMTVDETVSNVYGLVWRQCN